MYGECNVLMERVLLTLHGDAHTCRRAIEWKLFRRDFARFYEREIYPNTLNQTLAPYLASGHMDLPEFGFRVNINLSADIAGIDRPEGSTARLTRWSPTRVNSVKVPPYSTRHATKTQCVEVGEALESFKHAFFVPSRDRREQMLQRMARVNSQRTSYRGTF